MGRPGGVGPRRACRRLAPGPGIDLLHVGDDRPVQGRDDAPGPDVLLRRRVRVAHPPHRRRHLHGHHAAVPRQRPVPGRLPGPGRRGPLRAAQPVLGQPLDRPDPRLGGDGHKLPRRDDGLRLQAGTPARRRRQRPALHLRGPHRLLDHRRVQGPLRGRGLRGGVRTHRDLHADPVALRRGPPARRGRTRRRRLVRRAARGPRHRRGGGRGRARRAGHPDQGAVDVLDGLLRHAGGDRGGLAQPLVPHR